MGFPPVGNALLLGEADLGTPGLAASGQELERRVLSAAAPVMGASQMAEAAGLAHTASPGLGPERGCRGLRISEMGIGDALFTGLSVRKVSPEERLQGEWPAPPP